MDSKTIVEEIVDDIFECPFYSEMQMQRATNLLDEKFKEDRKQLASELLELPLDDVLIRLEEIRNG